MDIDETKDKLASKKSNDRRRAAKEIGKSQFSELAGLLYKAFLEESKDKRTWETQVAMINSLGLLNHAPAIKEIESIVNNNLPHDSITSAATTSYVRLKRKTDEDASTIVDLLKRGSFSVASGALITLALDQMHPPMDEIKEIVKMSWDINKHKDRIGQEYGLIDARIYVALACWDWSEDQTAPFLNHCIDTAYDISRFDMPVENTNLINVCTNSLAGKISKGYL